MSLILCLVVMSVAITVDCEAFVFFTRLTVRQQQQQQHSTTTTTDKILRLQQFPYDHHGSRSNDDDLNYGRDPYMYIIDEENHVDDDDDRTPRVGLPGDMIKGKLVENEQSQYINKAFQNFTPDHGGGNNDWQAAFMGNTAAVSTTASNGNSLASQAWSAGGIPGPPPTGMLSMEQEPQFKAFQQHVQQSSSSPGTPSSSYELSSDRLDGDDNSQQQQPPEQHAVPFPELNVPPMSRSVLTDETRFGW